MSNREIVIDLIKNLPEDTSPQDNAREIELIAGIQTARAEAARGEGVTPEKARQLVDPRVSASDTPCAEHPNSRTASKTRQSAGCPYFCSV